MSQDEIEKESNRGTDQGDKLKEGGSAGLDLLFGGWMNIYGRFHSFGTGGGYWTSTDDAPLEDGPWRRWISSSSSQFNNDDMSRDDAYYCRCVKDED